MPGQCMGKLKPSSFGEYGVSFAHHGVLSTQHSEKVFVGRININTQRHFCKSANEIIALTSNLISGKEQQHLIERTAK